MSIRPVVVLRGNTELWMDGMVDGTGAFMVVIGDDGIKYRIPERDQEGLASGDRVQFVPRKGAFRRTRWSKKLLFRP